jgi:hypothetical protein
MRTVDSRSRLSIDIPIEERLWLKIFAAGQNRSINDFVLSCIRAHMPCNLKHTPNTKTAADLHESETGKGVISFKSPLEMFNYLGLPTTCLPKKSQKTLKKTSKKHTGKKKI